MIGVQLQPRLDVISLPLPKRLWKPAVKTRKAPNSSLKFLEGMVERRMSPKSLEGPIRIAQFAGDAAREGPASFFGLMAAVSLNLAVFNLLPIPILDGGVMLLLLVEMLLRRDLDLRVREAVVRVGLCVSDDGGGVRSLQRHLQDHASGLRPPGVAELAEVSFKPFFTAGSR